MSKLHINFKELLAVQYAVTQLLPRNMTAILHVDNAVVVSHLKRMGGRCRRLSQMTVEIWLQIINKKSFILPVWIGTSDNLEADLLSRKHRLHWDFGLALPVIDRIFQRWFIPDIDLFASNDFHVVEKYYSWLPDPAAKARDAFSQEWPERVYLFPPVPMILKALNRLQLFPGTHAIFIAPRWPSAVWFPLLTSLMIDWMDLSQFNHLIMKRADQDPAFLTPLAAWLLFIRD
jgi:hypothetical protein